MPTITSVELQKTSRSNLPRYNIFLDGKFAFGVDEDLVVNRRLVQGKTLTESEIDQILEESEVGKMMGLMYSLFSVRQRTEQEVRKYFKLRNFKSKILDKNSVTDQSVDLLISQLKQKGLLNDLEFAKSWVEARRRSKQKGAIALKSELIQKGIDREIIEQVLSVEVDEEALALESIQKKLDSFSKYDKLTFKKKVFDYLMRRGFDYSTIQKVWATIDKSDY